MSLIQLRECLFHRAERQGKVPLEVKPGSLLLSESDLCFTVSLGPLSEQRDFLKLGFQMVYFDFLGR